MASSPPRSPRTLATAAATFAAASVLGGLLVVGLALPVVGVAAATTNAAADELANLPLDFEPPAQSQRSQVLDANGQVLAYFYDENRVYVGLDQIAPVMRQAIVAIEDHRFYAHGPIDVQGTLRAFLRNSAAGGVTQGGSTITQQYVKMVQVEEANIAGDEAAVQAAQAGTYGRKIRELRYAISVEKSLTKDQILERYLNIAYFGDGAYGVEVAAEHYFGTTAAALSLSQAAMLAGLVQNPTGFNPVQHPSAAVGRRNTVLNRMAELEVAPATAVATAKETGFSQQRVVDTVSGCQGTDFPFLCDYVRRSLVQTPSLGATTEEREKMITRGGLTITTAIDPDTQAATQQAVNDAVGATDPVIGAMDLIQPGTGLVVAMAQSRPVMGADERKGQTYWNYSAPPGFGGNQGFQAGSTFKAFTVAAALEEGIPLSKQYDAKKSMDFSGESFETCAGTRQVSGDFTVRNSTGTSGVMDMYTAAQRSVNTYFVQLALEVGMCKVTAMAEKLGVESSTKDAPISSYDDKPSFTLGTVETSPLSMAEAYATFASGGIHCDPVIIDTITDPSGTALAAPSANCRRVISAEVADTMNELLSSVMTAGTGARAATDDGRPQAGKTGTIDGNAAVWFVGYTPQVAGAAMISVDNQRAPFVPGAFGYRVRGLKGYTVPSTGLSLEGSGSGDAGQEIWKPAMEEYLAGRDVERFNPAPPDLTGSFPGFGSGFGTGGLGDGFGFGSRPGQGGRR